jgi:Glycosyltransferase family 29 (sialyltransferase)
MSNLFAFLLARTLRHEKGLDRTSVPLADLMAALSGQSVALIGNARALAEGRHGADIDRADLVIRINRAPRPSALSHGQRTDWLALATSLCRADHAALGAPRVLWMSPKRKRLTHWLSLTPGFHLHPLPAFHALRATLGAPPTTGLMMIDLLSRSPARHIDLYGFDFFASQSLTGHRTAAQVPHDFAAERAFVTDLLARDPRFRLHAPKA